MSNIPQSILDAAKKITKINDIKTEIRSEIARSSLVEIDAQTPFAEYPDKLSAVIDAITLPVNESIITVTINPSNSDYNIPNDPTVMAELLNGAYIRLMEVGDTGEVTASVDSLINASYALRMELDATKQISVELFLGTSTPKYRAYPVLAQAKPGASTYLTINTHIDSGETIEIGRFQKYKDTTGASYLIKKIHAADGTVTTVFGAESSQGGMWIDYTGLKSSVYDYPGISHTTKGVVFETVWDEATSSYVSSEVQLSSYHGQTNTVSSGTYTTSAYLDPDATIETNASGKFLSAYYEPGTITYPHEKKIHTSGLANATYIQDELNCLKNMKPVDVIVHFDDPMTNKFMRYEPVYVKTERTTLDIPKLADDGNSVLSSTPTDVVIKWACNTQADPDYHLHTLFERSIRNEDNSYSTVSCNYGYIARFPINHSKTAKYNGVSLGNVGNSVDDYSQYGCVQRSAYLSMCKNLNQVPCTIKVDGEDDIELEGGTDPRRWSMVAHCKEVSFLQWMSYLLFGINAQAAESGICTGSVGAALNGVTNPIFDLGIYFGGYDTTMNSEPILFCGIEESLWGSIGWMTADLVFYQRAKKNEAGAVTQDGLMYFAQDRLDYNPGEDVRGSNTAGYRPLTFSTYSNTRLGYDEGIAARDLNIFGNAATGIIDLTVYPKALDNIYTAGVDAGWYSGIGSGSITETDVWVYSPRMVALGDYRTNGSSLGAFALSVNYGLANAYAHYWRSRLSLEIPNIVE